MSAQTGALWALLLGTGCRLGEIMTLKWDYIDFDERALRLPDSKTGKKVVHLGAPAVEYLRDAQRIDGNPWVITGTLTPAYSSNLVFGVPRGRFVALGPLRCVR